MNEITKIAARLIHRERKNKGWTQEELATKTGTCRQLVNRVETLERDCRFGIVTQLLAELGVSIQFVDSDGHVFDLEKLRSPEPKTKKKTEIDMLLKQLAAGPSSPFGNMVTQLLAEETAEA